MKTVMRREKPNPKPLPTSSKHHCRFSWPLASAVCAPLCLIALAMPANAQVLAPASVAKPSAFVSLDPVPRGKEFQVAIVVDIARGYHMNSHRPTDAYLIPTTLTPQLPAGFQLDDTIYPNGTIQKFAFSPDKALDVYSGSVTLRLRVTAKTDAALGAATIPVTLRYQACNDSACLPPVKVPVMVKLTVAAASAKAHPVHPEIFASVSGSGR
jgi:DsbC/DsbD-like thiol-disulfide interchange protein